MPGEGAGDGPISHGRMETPSKPAAVNGFILSVRQV
jgi:hypothetical protein